MGTLASFVETLESRRLLSVSPVAVATPPKPTNGGVSLTETAHDRFTVRLGEFTEKVIDLALNASIDWGDGTKSDGTLIGSYATGEYYVQGSHSYARVGTYAVHVNIFAHPVASPQLPGVGAIDQFDSVITVKPLLASPGGTTLTEIAGKQFKDTRLGEVTVKVTDLALNATIAWGDGTTSDGKMVGSYATGEYYIQGTHTYARPGTYKVDVKVFAKPIGSNIHPTDPIAGFTSVIHALGTTPGGTILTESQGQSFTVRLGEFHQKVSDLTLTAKITWGDGTTSDGTIEGDYATGDWYVNGTHTYAKTGIFTATVKIFAKPIGSPITPTDPINQFSSLVQVTPLAPSGGGTTLTETVNQKFTDARLGEVTVKVIDLALNATIDWGDGSKSDGKLDGSYATGEYYVEGTHTYTKTGTYKVAVKVFAHPIGSPNLGTDPIAQFVSVVRVNGK